MSITSSLTASGRDHDVPSAKVIFRDKLCLVSITRRDDTMMDASSISEEDIIEICITKSHTHPLGVLHYSTMESVVLFHSLDELQHATPSSPPPNKWVCPLGSREPKEDDWEVTFPGGRRFGSIEATHSNCRARAISWRKGFLWTTPVSAMPCSIWVRYGATDYHPDIGSVLGHPKNQYF